MRVPAAELKRQVDAAHKRWNFFREVERQHGLPAFMLDALGSRETDLNPHFIDHPGDGGHGHGLFQRDDRSWPIPKPYPLERQAEDAATLLFANFRHFKRWDAAVAAYNCGVGGVEKSIERGAGVDGNTTGGDYSADVLSRLAWIAAHYGVPSENPRAFRISRLLFAQKKQLAFGRWRWLIRGNDVEFVQQKVGASIDGRYGTETARLVRAFQAREHLVIDGIVGEQTTRALGAEWRG
jgi:peptidoglycan hydrolase-like protein with peptidoglycan-binding domain